MSNRVAKIQQKDLIGRHCPTTQNLADIGSRGANIQQVRDLAWWTGPPWLADKNKWPSDVNPKENQRCERRTQADTTLAHNCYERGQSERQLGLGKVLRITAWIFRFISNTMKREKRKAH